MNAGAPLDLHFLEDSTASRSRVQRRRRNYALGIPATVTVVWLVFVIVNDHFGRVADHVVAAVTMVFGSFVAGSTPQGGGAVAFPVFTKILDVAPSVARTFSLSIQAVGMGSAALVIVVTRRRVVWRAVALAAPAAVVGFVVAVILTSDRSTPFWDSRLPGPYVKVTFTLVLAGMAWLVFLSSRIPVRKVDYTVGSDSRRIDAVLVVGGVVGGVASALVGSGADVALYLVVVLLLGVDTRVGVPTSVVVMAVVSIAGLVVLGLMDGQLSTEIVNDQVVAVGGESIEPTSLRQADLFGMWIAAIPVVAWGAPLGSWVASKLQARHLITFILSLAALEIISTLLFVDELRSDPGLMLYGVLGLVVAGAGLHWLTQNRQRLFDLPPFSGEDTLRRTTVDAMTDYSSRLDEPK